MLRTAVIDAIAILTTTYCFRTDKTLAFILTVMSSPNAADGPNHDKPVSREGRIYFGRDGNELKVLGQVLDDRGKPHPLDNQDWQLMRSCSPTAYVTAYVNELGDIEGNRPIFRAGLVQESGFPIKSCHRLAPLPKGNILIYKTILGRLVDCRKFATMVVDFLPQCRFEAGNTWH